MLNVSRASGMLRGAAVCVSLLLTACSTAEERNESAREAWLVSPHADSTSWSSRHWSSGTGNDECAACHADALPVHEAFVAAEASFEELPCRSCHRAGDVPAECARCHATGGYLAHLGLEVAIPDGVDGMDSVGVTVECAACHNDSVGVENTSVMPSGARISGLRLEVSCIDCHQGRHSTVSVDRALAGQQDDAVNPDLTFIDIHNQAAGPSQHGTVARGGYEYGGRTYAGRYDHVAEFATCVDCHDAHSTAIRAQSCTACHAGANTPEGRRGIRVTGTDFDGDGSVREGLAEEILTLRERLLFVIQVYAARTKGTERIFYENRRPYFFDEHGQPYATWTPRLVRAAYNYRYTAASGGFAHNGRYHIQLLYDSMADLGADTSVITRP